MYQPLSKEADSLIWLAHDPSQGKEVAETQGYTEQIMYDVQEARADRFLLPL